MTENASSQNRPASSPFRLTFSSIADANGTPEGGEYVEALRIDGKSRRALRQVVRRHLDMQGPIGLFGDVLSDAQLRSIPASIDAIQWGSLPRGTGGDMFAPDLTLDYALDQKIIRRTFSAQDGEFSKAIDPILSVVREIQRSLDQKPLRAISLTVVRTPAGFKLTWRNIGVGPVIIADPRAKAADGSTRGVALVRAKSAPGAMPGFWTPVPLAPSPPPLNPVNLPPGGALEIDTVPWVPPAPGEYGASAKWIDYAGPNVPEQEVMPRVPKPEEMNDPRPFVLRGGIFAVGFMLKVP